MSGLSVAARPHNTDIAALSLTAAGSATNATTPDFTNLSGRGVVLVVDITAISGTTPTLTVTIEGKDSTSGKYYTLLTSAALSTVSTTALTVYPGVTVAANTAASAPLPKTWRVKYSIAGTTPSVTATVSGTVIL